jgi:hypothetical protein
VFLSKFCYITILIHFLLHTFMWQAYTRLTSASVFISSQKCSKETKAINFSHQSQYAIPTGKTKSNKQEIPCTTEARSTFFGCRGSNSRFLSFFTISKKFLNDRVPSCLIFGIWDFGRIRE